MKAHIGVDADSGLTHTLVTTAAHVSDITPAHALLHGDEVAKRGCSSFTPKVRPEMEKISETANSQAVHTPNWVRATSTPDEFISAVPKSRMKTPRLHQSLNRSARP